MNVYDFILYHYTLYSIYNISAGIVIKKYIHYKTLIISSILRGKKDPLSKSERYNNPDISEIVHIPFNIQ